MGILEPSTDVNTAEQTVRDDRVLPATRILSLVIIPFLLIAFVVLFFAPHNTTRWFAWTIKPGLTPMILGSVYLGGAYFFARAAGAQRWHTIKGGFVPVGTFATLMGIATLLHWAKFNHSHVAFWLWAGLYFTTPFLVFAVYFANRRYDAPPGPADALLPLPVARVIAAVGVLAVGMSAFLFVFPKRAITVWPWLLTPLTARVVGAIFALGIAATGTVVERRNTAVRLMAEVAAIMFALIAVAVARARGDVDGSRPLAWMFAVGFVAALAGCISMLTRSRVAGHE